MDNNNLFTPHQHGFRPGRSCITQQLETLEDWYSGLDSGSNIDVIYLDFGKAFDKVSHRFLIHKLRSYNIGGKILSWITAFLANNVQSVTVNGQLSTELPVTSGVPQGSVLGPILFLIYVNDMPDMLDCTIKLFADDTKLSAKITSDDDRSKLQENINKMCAGRRHG
ncbi:uncharacterized protein [Argopecten irradians]|uniref:uncharacterized protein n=1 Tax=Argopecten irradians TaxID=31199 RepID=UPI003716777B